MDLKNIKVGNIVRIEKSVVDKQTDLVGTIKAIFPNHVLVIDSIGLWYSIKPCDFSKMHLVQDSGFKTYKKEDYEKDIAEAFEKS